MKGHKSNPDIDPNVAERSNAQLGIITEDLLGAVVDHLTHLNVGELENEYSSNAIQCIKKAIQYLEDRKKDRENRGVIHTLKA